MKNLIDLMYILEPIFYKIVYMSIIASIIGITILIIRKLLKKQISSKWISRIWIIFIISLIIPIQFKSNVSVYNVIPINLEKIEEVSFAKENILEENKGKVQVSANLENNETSPNNYKEDKSFNILCLLPLLWLALVLTYVIACVITYISFEIKIKNKTLENIEINNILNKCKEKLSIKKNIKLIKQDIVKMPSIFGIFNIRILVSDDVLKLSEKEIEYIFLHELSHYKRKDNILNTIITILRCIYIFNPIVWLLLNQVKRDLELATDEFAMKNENSEIKKEYSKTLVKVSVINSDKFLIQTMCLSDNKKNIERRIDSIKLIDKFKENYKIISVLSFVIICLVIGIFYTESSNYMTLKDIIKLNQKLDKYTNAHCIVEARVSYVYKENPESIQSIYNKTEYFYKDNKICEKSTSNHENNDIYYSMSYINYDENEAIIIDNFDDKTINILDLSNVDKENRRTPIFKGYTDGSATNWRESEITDLKYKYIGKENINNRETYKIERKFATDYCNGSLITWFDKENGLRLKEEKETYYADNVNGVYLKEEHEILNYTYEFDVVADEDIQRPNLEEYPDYKIFRQSYLTTHF